MTTYQKLYENVLTKVIAAENWQWRKDNGFIISDTIAYGDPTDPRAVHTDTILLDDAVSKLRNGEILYLNGKSFTWYELCTKILTNGALAAHTKQGVLIESAPYGTLLTSGDVILPERQYKGRGDWTNWHYQFSGWVWNSSTKILRWVSWWQDSYDDDNNIKYLDY